MHRHLRSCLFLTIVFAACAIVVAQSATASASGAAPESELPPEVLQRVQQNDIDLSGMKPWYLKAEFHRFDSRGKSIEDGTFEQWWASPMSWRLEVHDAGHDLVFVRDRGKTYSKARYDVPPVAVDWLQPMLIEPVPKIYFLHSTWESEPRKAGPLNLDCLLLTRKPTDQSARGYMPYKSSLCFDQEQLRLSTLEDAVNFARNKIGTFVGHTVATEVEVVDRTGKIFSAEISDLRTIPSSAVDLSVDKLVENGVVSNFFVDTPPALAISPQPFSKKQPSYPQSARQSGLGGIVFLRALIGENGKVESVETLSTPSKDLARASEEAVKNWSYAPVAIDGHSVKFETMVEVRFNINGSPSGL